MFGINEPTGSHVTILEREARNASGLVIEHGAGLYSTPLLARIGCRVLCYETQPGWREWAQWVYDGRGEVMGKYISMTKRLPEAALVFIDGIESERAKLLEACFAANVPAIVAHDTHPIVWNTYGWRAEHFTPPGYAVEYEDMKDRYRTTVWKR